MKRIILFLSALFLIVAIGTAQTVIKTGVTSFAGTAADTLTASATKSYTLDLAKWTGKAVGVNVQLFTDLVSGTATFGYKYWWSNDGTNYPATAADSVAAAKSHASDWTDVIQITAIKGRYLKFSLIGTAATQKSTIYGYVLPYQK